MFLLVFPRFDSREDMQVLDTTEYNASTEDVERLLGRFSPNDHVPLQVFLRSANVGQVFEPPCGGAYALVVRQK